MSRSLEAWHPQPRLRHLQAVAVRGFAPTASLQPDDALRFQLHLLTPSSTPRLIYTSDAIALDVDLFWDAIWEEELRVPPRDAHEALQQQLRVCVLLARTDDAAGQQAICAGTCSAAAQLSTSQALAVQAAPGQVPQVHPASGRLLAAQRACSEGLPALQLPPSPDEALPKEHSDAGGNGAASSHAVAHAPRGEPGRRLEQQLEGSRTCDQATDAGSSGDCGGGGGGSGSGGGACDGGGGDGPATGGGSRAASDRDAGASARGSAGSSSSGDGGSSAAAGGGGDIGGGADSGSGGGPGVVQGPDQHASTLPERGEAGSSSVSGSGSSSAGDIDRSGNGGDGGGRGGRQRSRRASGDAGVDPGGGSTDSSSSSPVGGGSSGGDCGDGGGSGHGDGGGGGSGGSDGNVLGEGAVDPDLVSLAVAGSDQCRRYDGCSSSGRSCRAPAPLLQFDFSLDDLVPVDEAELKLPGSAANQLLLELQDGLYGLPGAGAQGQEEGGGAVSGAGRGAAGSGGASAGGRLAPGAMHRQFSNKAGSHMKHSRAALAHQQQFYRWMLSNSSSVLGGFVSDGPLSPNNSFVEAGSADITAAAAATGQQGGQQAAVGLVGFLAAVFGGQSSSSLDGPGPGPAPGASSRARGAAPAGAGSSSVLERSYDVSEFRAQLRRLTNLHARLADARSSCSKAQQRLAQLLAAHGAQAAQQRQLSQLREQLQQLQQLEQRQRRAAAAAAAAAAARRAALAQRVTAVRRAGGGVAARGGRLAAAAASVRDAGARLAALHAQLVARRSRLVVQLGEAYQVGPTTASPLDASPLADKLDLTWWSSGGDAGGGSGGGGGARGVPAARLLLAGLELPSSLARRGLEGSMGWGGRYNDEEARAAAALGYAAHLLLRLGAYLGVPLRFPLLPRMSRSAVIDPAPLRSGSGVAASDTRSGGWLARLQLLQPLALHPSRPLQPFQHHAQHHQQPHTPNGDPRADAQPELLPMVDVLPLHYDAGDRTRFAYAIYLLGKDVEQLLDAHGLASAGPTQLLGNLYTLIAAARSGLSPSGGAAWGGDVGSGDGGGGGGGEVRARRSASVAGAATWADALPSPPGSPRWVRSSSGGDGGVAVPPFAGPYAPAALTAPAARGGGAGHPVQGSWKPLQQQQQQQAPPPPPPHARPHLVQLSQPRTPPLPPQHRADAAARPPGAPPAAPAAAAAAAARAAPATAAPLPRLLSSAWSGAPGGAPASGAFLADDASG